MANELITADQAARRILFSFDVATRGMSDEDKKQLAWMLSSWFFGQSIVQSATQHDRTDQRISLKRFLCPTFSFTRP
jgi:hypothetical protein